MELGQRIVGQAARCGFQMGHRAVEIAVEKGDPAVGVLKGRIVHPAQAARNRLGPGEVFGVAVERGDQRGKVVGDHDVRAVFGIEPLIKGNRLFDLAVALQHSGLEPAQGAGCGLGGKARIQNRGRLGRLTAGGENPVHKADRGFLGRVVGDQGAVGGDGGVQLAVLGVEAGGQQAQVAVLRGLGQLLVKEGAGKVGVTGAQMGLNRRHGGRLRPLAPVDLGLKQRQRLVRAALAGEDGRLQFGEALLTGGQFELGQKVDRDLGLGPFALRQIEVGEGAQDVDIVRCDAPGVGQGGFRKPGVGVGRLEAGVAQGFDRGRARGFDRLGQKFLHPLGAAVTLLRQRQKGKDFRIARRLFKGGVQIEDGGADPVLGDGPAGTQLKGGGICPLFGEDLFDQGAGTDTVAGAVQHLGQRALDVAGLPGGFGGGDDALNDGNGLSLLTGVIVHRGEEGGIHLAVFAVAIGRDQRRKLGAPGVGAAGVLDELHHGEVKGHRAGQIAGKGAQKGLGAGEVLLGHVPADQRPAHLGIVGKAAEHELELRAGGGGLIGLGQQQILHHVVFKRAGVAGQRVVNHRQRQSGVRAGHHLINHDAAGDGAVGQGLQERAGLGGDAGAGSLVAVQNGSAVIERQLDGHNARHRWRKGNGGAAMTLGLFPAVALNGHLGQNLADIGRVGILFDQAQILAVRLGQLAALDQDIGIGLARLKMEGVVFEDIAKLDQGAVLVAGCQQGLAGLEILHRLFLVGFAARQRHGGHKGQGQGKKAIRLIHG